MEIFTKPSYSVGLFSDVYDSPDDAKTLVEVYRRSEHLSMLSKRVQSEMKHLSKTQNMSNFFPLLWLRRTIIS